MKIKDVLGISNAKLIVGNHEDLLENFYFNTQKR